MRSGVSLYRRNGDSSLVFLRARERERERDRERERENRVAPLGGKVCVSTIESIIIFHVGGACARTPDIIPFALPRRRGQPEVEELAALRYPAVLDSFDSACSRSRAGRIDDSSTNVRRGRPPRPLPPPPPPVAFPDSAAGYRERNIKTHEIRSFNIGILGIAILVFAE